MKRLVAITAALAVALTVCAIGTFLIRRPPKISMTVVKYRKWPHGATLRLTNGTGRTIRYFTEPDVTPTGIPLLRAQETTNGWTSSSARLRTIGPFTPPGRTRPKVWESFFVEDPVRPVGASAHELKPGRSADFFVRLEPDAAPVRVGTFCVFPENRLVVKVRAWLSRVEQWCHIKSAFLAVPVPGQLEIWCPDPLSVSESGEPGGGEASRAAK